jgi:hypothetical protein
MKRDLTRDEFSKRDTTLLPPHAELTHGPGGTLRALFAELAPQARGRREGAGRVTNGHTR